jgi:hypothetical protein
VSQSTAVHHIFSDHFVFSPRKQIPPRQDLNLAVPDDKHLEGIYFGLHGVEALGGVGSLPFFELAQEEIQSSEELHQGGLLAVKACDNVVGQEQALVQKGTFILVTDDNVTEPDQ